MSTNANKVKWLLSLVLIFGGFFIYQIFSVLAVDLARKEYGWIFKIISEFGLFMSVIISVGYFHHWLISDEQQKNSEKSFHDALIKYVDTILLSAVKRGFSGITTKELDFSEIMRGLGAGDYVYWLITFDPRYKHQCREIENAVRDGVHFRMIILKENCIVGELRAREITGINPEEFNEYTKFFKISLQDVISRIDENMEGSLGVFVSDGLPSIPLFIVIRKKSRKIEVYSGFYLTESVGRMPFMKWQSELKYSDQPSFESEHWNITNFFLDYFQKRWDLEREKIDNIAGDELEESDDFLYAPVSAKKNCSALMSRHKADK